MAIEFSFGNLQAGLAPKASISPRSPFRLAVLGDFSGRANRKIVEPGPALAGRRPRSVDRDNVEEVLSQLEVRLAHTIADCDGQSVAVAISELDDFLPDRLFGSLPLFAHLRELRRRLLNNDTFADAADEVRSWGVSSESTSVDEAKPSDAAAPADEPTIDDILGTTLEQTLQTNQADSGAVDWSRLVADIVGPYIVPGADPQQGELVACVDSAIAKSMSALLHHKDLQALEAAWRGLDLLVRRVETDGALKIYLIDVSKEEIAADLTGADDLAETGIYRLLVEQTLGTPGGLPWSLVVGNFMFDATDEDADLLGRMAKIAAASGAPFVAAAGGDLVGCAVPDETPDPEDWAERPESDGWTALRELADASFVGLLWPRFLLRLPYGKRTNPITSFAYEETDDDWSHDGYLWGNPAIAFGCLMAQGFTLAGWDMRPGQVSEIGNLPVHVYELDGDPEAHPCGELLLGTRGIERVLSRGLIPLLSVRGQDVVRLGSVQSLGGQPLRGAWG